MQYWSDNCASFGVSLKHQQVKVRQEGVTDIQNISGRLSESVIPGNRVLSLRKK